MTKDKIGKTFIELTRTRSADKITVKDIVDACGVTRQTFYYHFQDIEDVIDWIFTSSMHEALERTLNMVDMFDSTRLLVEDVVKNGEMILKLYNSKRHQHVESTLFCTVKCYLKYYADKMRLYRGFDEYEEKTALDLYSYAIAGVLIDHIEAKNTDTEIIIKQIHALLTGSLAGKIQDNFDYYLENKEK